MKTPYKSEAAMYPEVARWLEQFLRAQSPKATVETFPAAHERLHRVLARKGVQAKLPPEWQSWDVKVDVVGILTTENSLQIALVECKLAQINIAHLSQAIGYSRIVRPRWSFLVSPRGLRDNLRRLLTAFNRQDILVYTEVPNQSPRSLVLARWDAHAQQIDWGSALPKGIR